MKKQHKILTSDPRVLSLEDSAYQKAVATYRASCGMPPLAGTKSAPANFSGKWWFNEEESRLDNNGTGFVPEILEVEHNDISLNIIKTIRQEDADDMIIHEAFSVGEEKKSTDPGSSRIVMLNYSANGDTMLFESKTTIKRGEQYFEMISKEKWYTSDNMRTLFIKQTSSSLRQKRNVTLVYDRL